VAADAVTVMKVASEIARTGVGLMGAAERLGETLCATAYWHEERCNWVGRSPREATEPGMPITPIVTALGPELYSGTAGIALFLAQLHARTHTERTNRTAQGAVRQALSRSGHLPAGSRRSFYSGLVGIAYTAARVGLLLDDAGLVAHGIELAQGSVAASDRNQLLDVIGGNAGAIAPLLWLMKLPGGEVLEKAIARTCRRAGRGGHENGTEHGAGKTRVLPEAMSAQFRSAVSPTARPVWDSLLSRSG
jgi:lantibiotic modifying enzyme